MAATFDARFEKGIAGSASPFAFVSNAGDVSGTVGGWNRVLIGIVEFSVSAATVGTVTMTWNGVSMTQIGTGLDTPAGVRSVFMFGLINPDTGNQTLSCGWSGAVSPNVALGAISVADADQATGWQNAATNTGTSTAMTVAVTTTAGELAVVGAADNNAGSATIIDGVSAWNERDLSGNYQGGYNQAIGASTSASWTLNISVAWACQGVSVMQAVVVPKPQRLDDDYTAFPKHNLRASALAGVL